VRAEQAGAQADLQDISASDAEKSFELPG